MPRTAFGALEAHGRWDSVPNEEDEAFIAWGEVLSLLISACQGKGHIYSARTTAFCVSGLEASGVSLESRAVISPHLRSLDITFHESTTNQYFILVTAYSHSIIYKTISCRPGSCPFLPPPPVSVHDPPPLKLQNINSIFPPS